MGGDTQMIWSFHYLALFSLTHFGEFLWWDPTAYGGWPAYFYWISAWTNYLGPYTLPSLALIWLGDTLSPLHLNKLIVLQKTLYYFVLNLVAIVFISRGLIRNGIARFFPPLTFTLCEITFHGFRDAALYEALPGPLFYIAALIHFNNRRTAASLLIFIAATALLFSNLSYGFLQSSFYWTGVFTLLLLLLFPDLFATAWQLIKQLYTTPSGRACLVLGGALLVTAFWAFYAPVHYNIGHLLRVSGAGPVDYRTGLGPGWDAATKYGIDAGQGWNNLLMWTPLPDLHEHALRYDKWGAGIDHRYIGLATVPLLLVAAVYGRINRYIVACFMTSFICGVFLVYTVNNPLFSILIDHSVVFKNIRTISHTMPREGPALFLIFMAGMGLDILLQRHMEPYAFEPIGLRRLLAFFLSTVFVISFAMLVLAGTPAAAPVRHGLGHIAIYLAVFTGLVLLLVRQPRLQRRDAGVLAWCFIALVFMDLTISAGAYWDRGQVWFKNEGVHKLGEIAALPPITRGAQTWSGSYHGAVHSPPGGPWYGMREWLVLASRPAWQPTLENWNPATRAMTEYPALRFYTHGAYLPFDAIENIDQVVPPVGKSYGGLKSEAGGGVLIVNDVQYAVVPGFAGYVEHAYEHQDSVTLAGWAIDEQMHRPAEKVILLAGDRLWGIAEPRLERRDIAALGADYLRAGFHVDGLDLPKAARTSVRVYAVLANGTARELRYSANYPYSTKLTPGPSHLPLDRPQSQTHAGPFYLHDVAAASALAKRDGKLNIKWKIEAFTPNKVLVQTQSNEDSYMLYLDNYDPYWRATIDGREVPIYRANFTYKAVLLPAGTHRVEWSYNPWPMKIAWVVFYAMFLAFGSACFYAWRRKRRYYAEAGAA